MNEEDMGEEQVDVRRRGQQKRVRRVERKETWRYKVTVENNVITYIIPIKFIECQIHLSIDLWTRESLLSSSLFNLLLCWHGSDGFTGAGQAGACAMLLSLLWHDFYSRMTSKCQPTHREGWVLFMWYSHKHGQLDALPNANPPPQ